MKKNKSSKKILAVILAMVMILTSLPLMIVSAVGEGNYDPAPYWGDGSNNAALNTTFIATLNADGSLSVAFPSATPQKTYNGSAQKTITNYIFTITKLTDDGERKEIWSENFSVNNATPDRIGIFTVDNTEGNKYPNSIYYMPGDFESLGEYEVEASYDISIQAVDSDGWVSDTIHTLLSSTPYYIINDDYSPNESWIVREMALFEQKGSANTSDYIEPSNANAIDVNGRMDGMGYPGNEGKAGYRLWIAQAYSGTPYLMQTTWSRTHYNFQNAEEVWFYVDLSRVTVNKFAFALSANEKYIGHFRDGKYHDPDNVNNATKDNYGEAIFSTAAVAGKNGGEKTEGIYIQNADGLWESTSMTNGYFTDLSGYKGFIRIPIEYFVLQKDQYITGQYSMENWAHGGCELPDKNDDNLINYVNSERVGANDKVIIPSEGREISATQMPNGNQGILINPVGTCVTDAVVLYNRWETYGDWEKETINKDLKMIGYYNHSDDVTETVADDGSRTYTVNNPIYAITDLFAAGVQLAEWSADSVYKSFYIDQIMFCQKSTGATFDNNGFVTENSAVRFPTEGAVVNASGTRDVGRKMSGFYDRTVQVPKAVAEYINHYFGEIPSLNDINAKAMVDDIILEYIDCFGINSAALSDEAKVEAAIETLQEKHLDAYNKYMFAVEFINDYTTGGLDTTTSAVEAFESGVESLPNPEFANHNDEELQAKLKQLRALYETFNLSHYALLGADAEAKFLELHKLIVGEEVKTGQSIGAYPFIPFNDFEAEQNYSIGDLSNLYYDDINRSNADNKRYDTNNTKNLTTYVASGGEGSGYINQSPLASMDFIGNAIGWSVQDFRPGLDSGNGYGNTQTHDTTAHFGSFDAIIDNNGFVASQGAKLRLNGDLSINPTSSSTINSTMKFGTVSTTYKGQNVSSWTDLAGLNLAPIQLNGSTTPSADGTPETDLIRYGEGVLPNSFVMYVDFTEVQNAAFTVKFICEGTGVNGEYIPDGDYPCYFCAGGPYEADGTTLKTYKIYALDDMGEWTGVDIQASNLDLNNTFGDPAVCSIATAGTPLEGYKGFIRIPLSMFRLPLHEGIGNLGRNYYVLDNVLNYVKINQVKVSFWDYNYTNDTNIGKNIYIDSMGFTYDPKCTNRASGNTDCNGELNQVNGIDIKNMDEYFRVKTTDSSNFEKMVSTIDPYATEAEFKASYEACQRAYSALSPYQKSLDEVKYCYNELMVEKYQSLYLSYDMAIQQDQWRPLYTNAQQLLDELALVSDNAKRYKIAEESIAQLYVDHKEDFMNQLGFSSVEEANNVVTMYEIGYNRLSVAERNSISADALEALNNAYDAAQRAVLINGIIADVENFKANITGIYGMSTHTDDDADRIPDTEDPNGENRMVKYLGTVQDSEGNTVNALEYYTDMYGEISVFGKKLLNDDTNEAAAYKNMYDAAKAILDNSTAITPFAGASVPGGIITYERRLEAAYANLKPKVDAKATIDVATLEEVEYCLGQYEAFLRRYALVDELNYDYVELALLLPVADLNTESEAYFTNAEENPVYSYTANADLTYVATRLSRTVSVYLVTDYKWTQVTGSSYNFDYYTVNGNKGTDGSVVYTALGNYQSGETASFTPVITIDEETAKKVPTGNVYTGTVKLMAFDSTLITDGVDMSTLSPVTTIEIPITFESINGGEALTYEVAIPADIAIEWDYTGETDVSYTVVHASVGDGSLNVNVADSNADGNNINDMTATIVDSQGVYNKLEYIANNFGTQTFTGTITSGQPDPKPSITVEEEQWAKVPVGEYKTQLTYSVTLGDGDMS